MCCRYLLLRAHLSETLERLGVRATSEPGSRYNIAPGTKIPVIREKNAAGRRELIALRWGLVPAWTKEADPGAGLVNARAESLAGKPSFRDAFRERRCVVPTSGFYEWKVVGRTRQPWLFQLRDTAPFFFAGLWESWTAPDSAPLETCAVITTAPNELMQPIHHRMPAILPLGAAEQWLDPASDPESLAACLLQPFSPDRMTARQVSSRVNSVTNNDAGCLAAADSDSDNEDAQLAWGFCDDL